MFCILVKVLKNDISHYYVVLFLPGAIIRVDNAQSVKTGLLACTVLLIFIKNNFMLRCLSFDK